MTMTWLPGDEPLDGSDPPLRPLSIYADLDYGPPRRPPTAVGAPAPDFDELFTYIDSLDQYDLRRLIDRLHRYVPKWAWR